MKSGDQSRSEKFRQVRSTSLRDFYAVLGVPRDATSAEIKRAYRRLAVEHHPDKHSGDAEKFKEIGEAYEVLSDSVKRELWDRYGDDLRRQRDNPEPPSASPPPDPPHAKPRRRRRASWTDEDEPLSAFIGVINGVAHYHHGDVKSCIVCGFGVVPTVTLSYHPLPVTAPASTGDNLPGGAFYMPAK